ncbi:hypothetical protein [Acaryochloris sp. CCMEE 5410]|uniref:hypothetical protein n=1 Tax=Acaryochloris sp. CCMEE 5410 TaxID=310037 RepID=UPI0002483D82|nr:hypothetical protein [Acaryochloris sp. CCMEE 5410]KAI9130812.1 hypothetical protein ON05_024020 [Acaryochloris sp. CCMEE 5410]
MVLARIVTMIGILLGVVAVLIQNQSPTLALVFLGMRSQPLPLGLWIAAAVVIGALLSLGLFAILSATSAPSRKARRRSSAQRSPFKRPAKPKTERESYSSGYSDWDEPVATEWNTQPADSFFDDEPDYYDDPVDYPEEDDYDDPTPPWEKRDSAYSYSYRDPEFAQQSSQRESVFDAEYRVIKPPQRPEADDNWDEFDDSFRED